LIDDIELVEVDVLVEAVEPDAPEAEVHDRKDLETEPVGTVFVELAVLVEVEEQLDMDAALNE
jgi:hypothetical protein